MHIAIAAPVLSADIVHLLDTPTAALPKGFAGAPVVTTLIEALLSRGHTLSVVTTSSDMPLRRGPPVVARGPNLSVHYVPSRARAWPFNGLRPGRIVDLFAFERAGLKGVLADLHADMIHAHWSYEFAWAAQDTGQPCLITCHDSPATIARFYRGRAWRYQAYRWLRAAMAWRVLRRARAVTTVSPYMQQALASWSRVPITVVPNPIAAELLTRSAMPESGRRRVLMVCNGWDARKNPENGLRAFAEVSRRLTGTELLLFGSGFGPGESAEQWWQSEGLRGNVQFLGAVTHADVLSCMLRSDVLLHPALEESFGAVLAEAMAAGLPVIAGGRSGAVPWVLGAAGALVDVTSVAAIAETLHALLLDEERRRAMALQGRAEVAARFSADAVADAYEQQYDATLSKWKGRT